MTGEISGTVEAECTKCQCRFSWHIESMPFVGSKFVGICDKCLNKESHDCVNEFEEEDGSYKIKGRKEFNEQRDSEENRKSVNVVSPLSSGLLSAKNKCSVCGIYQELHNKISHKFV